MGFYHDPNIHGNRSASPILIALISAIVGGVIVTLLTPLMIRSGVFSPPSSSMLSQPMGPIKTANVQVTTNITAAVEKVKPAVVGVVNLKNADDPFFLTPQKAIQKGAGSGIIFESSNGKARIVTNHHVIEGNSQIQVVIPDGTKSATVSAKVLGSDPITDLAVLEISNEHVKTVAQFGNSDILKAGEPAIAIGNPLDLGPSVTVGVVSSPKRAVDLTDRMVTDMIQTDAAINPGNSGGALINGAGQVIGINSLKVAESGVEGLGFAIPINDAWPIIENLIKLGTVPRVYLGIALMDLRQLPTEYRGMLNLPSEVQNGVVIRGVYKGTPAEKAGLKTGDVIIELDHQPVLSSSELRKYMYRTRKIGEQMTITYYRSGQKKTASVTLTKAPTTKEN